MESHSLSLRYQRSRLVGFVLLTVFASHHLAAAPPVPPVNANVTGVWGTLGNWPLIAIHSILTRDGRVLTYGTDGSGKQTGLFIYDVWDPESSDGDVSAGHMTLPNTTTTDLFCSSHVLLPGSNSILIAGGDVFQDDHTLNKGNSDANLFSGDDNMLRSAGTMWRERWYSTLTTLVNGESYIQGGMGSGNAALNGKTHPEVRGLDGSFRLLSHLNTSALSYFYPRNYVAPNGTVFGYDVKGKTYFLSSDLSAITMMAPLAPGTVGTSSSSALYAPGKILQFGGPTVNSVAIDINGIKPKVTSAGKLSSIRHWVNATLLPNGRVLATGGSSVANKLTGVNNRAEIWNPATRQWKVGAAGALARLYHSTALLLPDATVLVAGGGAPGPLKNTNAEIYYPPYLFAAGGLYASRPAITSAPPTLVPGQEFLLGVSNASNVARVTVVKTGAVTHSFNMDQRFVQLSFARVGNSLRVTAHPNPAVLTPGAYMLFVINGQAVPSKAAMIEVTTSP